MSTPKRERQRENRRLRLVADEAAAKQYASRRRVRLIGIAAVVVAAAIAVIAFLQRDDSEVVTSPDPLAEVTPADPSEAVSAPDPQTADPVPELATGCPAADGSSGRVIDFDGPQPMCIDPETRYVATFDTSEGELRFELTASDTPLTVNNFVTLARWGYYDDTLLFRTDPSIDIIQGGSPHTNTPSDPGPGYTIPDEPAFDLDPDTGAAHRAVPLPAWPARHGPIGRARRRRRAVLPDYRPRHGQAGLPGHLRGVRQHR